MIPVNVGHKGERRDKQEADYCRCRECWFGKKKVFHVVVV